MITRWQRELNYAELENRKGVIPQSFEESPLQLGIIRYTAQYPGWRGMLYDESRYVYRGKFAASRFEKTA